MTLACVVWLGCGDSPDARPHRANGAGPPRPSAAAAAASVTPASVVPAGPSAARAAVDPRPPAFVAFSGQCPAEHERFESVCVHDDYMRRTPLTRLMDEVIAFRNGAPAPRVGTAPGQQPAPELTASDDGEKKPLDPSTLDPGALVASPEQVAEREQSVDDAARHRGEQDKRAALRGATPRAAAIATRNGVEPEPGDGQQARAPKVPDSLELDDQRKPELEQALEKVKTGQLSQADCQYARANAAEARRNNCSLPESERAICAALLTQLEASAAAMCALAQ